jgi:hypothetical protein
MENPHLWYKPHIPYSIKYLSKLIQRRFHSIPMLLVFMCPAGSDPPALSGDVFWPHLW